MIQKFATYLSRSRIWQIRLKNVHPVRAFFIRIFRIILLVIQRVMKNQCELRASALTFYSVLSIVPMVAMAFGISKGFGFEKILEEQLYENFPGQEEVLIRIITIARSLLEQTKGGMIAGVGLMVLMWTVLRVLLNIEYSFNIIWEVSEARSFSRKFSDYLSIMMICPLLVIVSSSATVFITTQVTTITENIALLGIVSPLIFSMLKLLPYCLIWILFTIIYIFMPNTRVNFWCGAIAGVIAGTTYQIAQWAYINFQVGVANYNAIYGSFAALPLFLVWMQISWLIVLFGAEISFACQNVNVYESDTGDAAISFNLKTLFCLQITHLSVKNFSKGDPPLTDYQISRQLSIPLPQVRKMLRELVELRILSRTENFPRSQAGAWERDESAYQPARDIQLFTIAFIVNTLAQGGIRSLSAVQSSEFKIFSESLQEFRQTIEKSPANKRLTDV